MHDFYTLRPPNPWPPAPDASPGCTAEEDRNAYHNGARVQAGLAKGGEHVDVEPLTVRDMERVRSTV